MQAATFPNGFEVYCYSVLIYQLSIFFLVKNDNLVGISSTMSAFIQDCIIALLISLLECESDKITRYVVFAYDQALVLEVCDETEIAELKVKVIFRLVYPFVKLEVRYFKFNSKDEKENFRECYMVCLFAIHTLK